jgi:hypothetical protein
VKWFELRLRKMRLFRPSRSNGILLVKLFSERERDTQVSWESKWKGEMNQKNYFGSTKELLNF